MSKVGDIIELFRNQELIEQARILKMSKIEELGKSFVIEYVFEFGDGYNRVFRYQDKQWFEKVSEISFDHDYQYPTQTSFEKVKNPLHKPYHLFELKKKYKKILYISYDQRKKISEEFESWRFDYKIKHKGTWPSFEEEEKKRVYLKNKLNMY